MANTTPGLAAYSPHGSPPPGPAPVPAFTGGSQGRGEGPPASSTGGPSAALYKPLTELEIVAAVPEGSRRLRSQKAALRALLADPELAELRADFRGNVLEVWRFLVRWAFAGDGTSMPVRARLCAELGLSPSTWKRCRRWLERHRWLGTVRKGFTAILRPLALADDQPNEAAVYVLASPVRKTKPTRPANLSDPLSGPLIRQPSVTDPSHWSPKPRVKTGSAAADAATHYRRHVAVLRQGPVRSLTDKWVAWAARPFLRAGYSPADLGYAIGYAPGSGRHKGSASDVRNPGAWLGWRLSRWFADPDAAWQSWRDRGRWPDEARPVESYSQRAWRHVTPIGEVYLERSRAKARTAAAGELARSHAAAIRDRLGWRK